MGEGTVVLDENEFAMALILWIPFAMAMLGTQCHASINQCDYGQAAAWADQAARCPGSHYLLGMLAAAANEINGDRSSGVSLGPEVQVAVVQTPASAASLEHFRMRTYPKDC